MRIPESDRAGSESDRAFPESDRAFPESESSDRVFPESDRVFRNQTVCFPSDRAFSGIRPCGHTVWFYPWVATSIGRHEAVSRQFMMRAYRCCPAGHALTLSTKQDVPRVLQCDDCPYEFPENGEGDMCCNICEFDVCKVCVSREVDPAGARNRAEPTRYEPAATPTAAPRDQQAPPPAPKPPPARSRTAAPAAAEDEDDEEESDRVRGF